MFDLMTSMHCDNVVLLVHLLDFEHLVSVLVDMPEIRAFKIPKFKL